METYVIAVMKNDYCKKEFNNIGGYYSPSKYSDMWNLSTLEGAEVFEDLDSTVQMAERLTKRFKYNFQVFNHKECLINDCNDEFNKLENIGMPLVNNYDEQHSNYVHNILQRFKRILLKELE